MRKTVSLFLAKHWEKHRPLLLGYSGGPDSKALLYTLLDAGCKSVHLAHVDHGWRGRSAEEATALELEAKSLGLPFFTCRLESIEGELAAREARFAFFLSLFKKVPFQALLLAHQAEDRAETVLKRVLEGAHLPFLGGMEEVSQMQGMELWRPLLSVHRKEIDAYLKSKHLEALIDPTNFDPAYLRARMRLELFPLVEKHFGKGIAKNLSCLSDRAYELKAYLENKTSGILPNADLSKLERIEARYLLQKWAKIPLSRDLLERVLDAIFSKKPNKKIAPGLLVDRGQVIFLKATPSTRD
jgi:tRNA(Ile)-lysidine synthase